MDVLTQLIRRAMATPSVASWLTSRSFRSDVGKSVDFDRWISIDHRVNHINDYRNSDIATLADISFRGLLSTH